MASVSASVPAESDMLCERCGYVLNGLPGDSRCPECGTPITESDASLRGAPDWERAGASKAIIRFVKTSAAVIFQPARFYRTFATRLPRQSSASFARIHWLMASLLFGYSAFWHLHWSGYHPPPLLDGPLLFLIFSVIAYVSLDGITWLAAKLTNMEATYRSIRLPLKAVRRAMDYHAAHYLPVALLTTATVVGFGELQRADIVDARWSVTYLYVLCGEVIVCAGYLFHTYWTAMRNMMFANA